MARPAALLLTAVVFTAASWAEMPQPVARAASGAVHAPARTAAMLARRVLNAGPVELEADRALHDFVKKTAEGAIAAHCASCHGADLKGARPGVPDLTDYDVLWNTGATEEIDATQVLSLQQTILWGVRDQDCPDTERKRHYGACPDTRYSHMPAYGKDGVFNGTQIADLAEYVLQLAGRPADAGAAERGKQLYAQGCGECHGADGFGYGPYGGPNLTDDVWLYGGSRAAIVGTITNGPGPDGGGGYCPPWSRRLDAVTIKALAIYIHGKQSEDY
jgi:cytochrome c oxidase cbb3-type subunit 3